MKRYILFEILSESGAAQATITLKSGAIFEGIVAKHKSDLIYIQTPSSRVFFSAEDIESVLINID